MMILAWVEILDQLPFCAMTTPTYCALRYNEKNVSWLLKAVETFSIQQNDRNGHIYIRVMKQHIP